MSWAPADSSTPASGCAPLPISPTQHEATKAALRRYQQLTKEIRELDAELPPLVTAAAPERLALAAVSIEVAGQLLFTAGDNPDRLHSEAAFAHLCGVAPIPASSGRTNRHRLNCGGDQAANTALHTIALSRLRWDPRTPRLHRSATTRRTHPPRSNALPQAIHRPRGLSTPHRPPTGRKPQAHRGLTNHMLPLVEIPQSC